jgi:hypothetical protein
LHGLPRNIFGAALYEDVGQDPSFEELKSQRYNQNIVQLAYDWNEIRKELDGTKDVAY